ncbi:MAG: hypothetical protein WBC06_04335 [Chitinophagaceae bacterium]
MNKGFLLAATLSFILDATAQNVGIGTPTPSTKLHIVTTDNNMAIFSGGNQMWITLAENNINRGYIGSYAGNAEDVDFGTYGSNLTGKVHLTTGNLPRLTIMNNGNVGIGTTNPGQQLEIGGGIKIGNTVTNLAGSIRYTNNRFEGYNGSSWNRFDQLPVGTLVVSLTYPNAELENTGFKYVSTIKDQPRLTDVTGVAADSWLPTATLVAEDPESRASHSAVWTGTEMIIWGGADGSNTNLNTGSRYNPVSNAWKNISVTNAPQARNTQKAIWTGTQMIIWGGIAYPTVYNNGGKYDPAIDIWTNISSTGAPSARVLETVLWTGTEMIVWGGRDLANTNFYNDGAKYNPVTDIWTPITSSNAPSIRCDHTAIWTGTEMIIWGGNNSTDQLQTGAKYNPFTNTWTTITITNTPVKRNRHTAVWTGSEMIIWGGNNAGFLNSGGRYNPSTDNWVAVSTVNAPSPRPFPFAAWTGTKMIIWGEYNVTLSGNGSIYNPTNDSWTPISTTNQPLTNGYPAVSVWTGREFIVQGGVDAGTAIVVKKGGRYYPDAQPFFTTAEETIGYLYLYRKL